MSLRGEPVLERARLADGREVEIRVGVPDDGYIPKRELDTVSVELRERGHVLAAINSILSAEDTSQARRLAREIKAGLESGELEPTAGAIEPLAEAEPPDAPPGGGF